MAEKKVMFIPTVHAFQSLHLIAGSDGAKRNIEKAVEEHADAARRACDKGVNVVPGSDSGPAFIPYGKSYDEELRIFLKAGIPYETIIEAASMGPLRRGMAADFLVLDGLEIKKVMIHGKFLS
jgi:predicted amidohydrolase YtcJ